MGRRYLCSWLGLAAVGALLLTGCGGPGGPASAGATGTVAFTFKWPAAVQSELITAATDELLVRCTSPDHPAQIVAARKAEVGADGLLRKTIELPEGVWHFQVFGFTNLGALEVWGGTDARVLADTRTALTLSPVSLQRSATLQWAMLPDAGSLVYYADQGTRRRLILRSISFPPVAPGEAQTAGDPPLTWDLTVTGTDSGSDWLGLSATKVSGAQAAVEIAIDRSRLPFLVNVAIVRIDAGAAGLRELAIVVTNGNAPVAAIPDPLLVGEWTLQTITRNGTAMPRDREKLTVNPDYTWRRDNLDTGENWEGVLQVTQAQAGGNPGQYQMVVTGTNVAGDLGDVRAGQYAATATALTLTDVDAQDEWVETFTR